MGVGLLLAKFFFLPCHANCADGPGKKPLYNYRTGELSALVVISALSGAAYPAF